MNKTNNSSGTGSDDTVHEPTIPEWADIKPSTGRRLTAYLLIDTSSSMKGAGIASVNQGIDQFCDEVAADQFSRELTQVAVIPFNTSASLVGGEPCTVTAAKSIRLSSSTSRVSRLDLAFDIVGASIRRDLRPPVKGGVKGDYRPIVFVLTGTAPTDEAGSRDERLWRAARDRLTDRNTTLPTPASFVGVGCGPEVDDGVLKGISMGAAFRVGNSSQAFVSLFQWLSELP